jgi:hypothetical protein
VSSFTGNLSRFFTSPVYVLYVLYVTKTTQSKVVGALRAPTNNTKKSFKN